MTPARRRARGYRHEALRATRSRLRVDSRGMPLTPGDQATSTSTTTDAKWGHFKRPRWGHCKRPRPTTRTPASRVLAIPGKASALATHRLLALLAGESGSPAPHGRRGDNGEVAPAVLTAMVGV